MSLHRNLAPLALVLAFTLAPAVASAGDGVGFFEPTSRRFLLLHDLADGVADTTLAAEAPHRARPVAGDWDGDGVAEPGWYDPRLRRFTLLDSEGRGVASGKVPVRTWRPWLRPLAGDWDGDGRHDLGLYDRYARRIWLLDREGSVVHALQLRGSRTWTLWPLAEDFDGRGADRPALFDARRAVLHRLAFAGEKAQEIRLDRSLARRSLRPVALDPDGDGRDALGLYERGTGRLYLVSDLARGVVDGALALEEPHDGRLRPIAGAFVPTPPPGGGGSDVPDTEHCRTVADVDPALAAYEAELVARMNALRATGAECGQEGTFPPVPPLAESPPLRCATRLHARELAQRDEVSQFGADGSLPEQRAAAAGYAPLFVGELVAGGTADPEVTLAAWLADPIRCSMLVDPAFTDAAAGLATAPSGLGTYWVLDLGLPQP